MSALEERETDSLGTNGRYSARDPQATVAGGSSRSSSALESTADRVTFDPLRDKSYRLSTLGAPLADFLAWMELGGAAERTVQDYEWAIGSAPWAICRLYPDLSLPDITDAELSHVFRQIPPKGRRTKMAAYSSFLKWARKTRRMTSDPMEMLPSMKPAAKKVIDVFTDVEIAALTGLPEPDGTLMLILFDAGLRRGEARRLRYLDFRPDPAPGELVILGSKGAKDRVVRITERLAQRLAGMALVEGLDYRDHFWRTVQANGSGFRRESRATPASDSAFYAWWCNCLADARVRHRSPHTTRHTFATRWLRNGGRLGTLSSAMGHASISTTDDYYSHLDTRDMAEDVLRIEAATTVRGDQ